MLIYFFYLFRYFYLLSVLKVLYFFIVYQYLLVFRDSRPVESCTRVGEVSYLKHFLAVACSAALSRQCVVAIALAV